MNVLPVAASMRIIGHQVLGFAQRVRVLKLLSVLAKGVDSNGFGFSNRGDAKAAEDDLSTNRDTHKSGARTS